MAAPELRQARFASRTRIIVGARRRTVACNGTPPLLDQLGAPTR